jgi:hypothetical protein
MPDPLLQSYLNGAQIPDEMKADLWDHFTTSTDEGDLQRRMDSMQGVPDNIKGDLWDMRQKRRLLGGIPQPAPRPTLQTGYILGDPTKPAHIGAGPSEWQETAQGFLNNLTDPKNFMPAAAGAIATPFTGGMSIPAAASIMGGATAVGTAAGRQMTPDNIPQPPLGWDLLTSFAGGAAPELFSPMGRSFNLFKETPQGIEARQLLGNKAGLRQVSESPVLDWIHNVANAGLGGTSKMAEAAQGRSAEELHALSNASESFAPAGGAKLWANPAQQGADVRQAVLDRGGQFYSNIVKPAYDNFNQQFGQNYIIDPLTGTPIGTVKSFTEMRSEIGNEISMIDPDKPGGRQARAEKMKQLDNVTKLIESNLPPNGRQAWDFAKAAHGYYKDTFENRTVQQLLQSPTKDTDVLEMLFNPQKGLRTSDETVYAGGRGQQISRNNYQLLAQAKKAMGQEEWQHTAVASVQHLVNAATDDNGMLNGMKLKNLYEQMDPDARDLLFGAGQKGRDLGKLINTIAYAERPAKTAAGTLFINIRQGAAMMKLAGTAAAAGSIAGAAIGSQKGREEGALAGLGTAGAVLLSPRVFATILTSPTARDLLVKSATAATPTLKQQLVRAAIAAGEQEFGRATVNTALQEGTPGSQTPNGQFNAPIFQLAQPPTEKP